MGNFVGKAVLNNNDSATIWLYSDTNWSSLNWSSKVEGLGFPHSTLLFNFTNSGIGVLEDSKTLKIELSPVPPGVFSITTNQGIKNFELIDAITKLSPVWTKASNFTLSNIYHNNGGVYSRESVVYLSNQYQQYFNPTQCGILYQGENKKAIYRGTGGISLRRSSSPQGVWPFGVVFFHTLIWLDNAPISPENYILKTTLTGNKGDIQLEVPVTLSDTEVINPNHSFYTLNGTLQLITNKTSRTLLT